jgi:hypothetical protein
MYIGLPKYRFQTVSRCSTAVFAVAVHASSEYTAKCVDSEHSLNPE